MCLLEAGSEEPLLGQAAYPGPHPSLKCRAGATFRRTAASAFLPAIGGVDSANLPWVFSGALVLEQVLSSRAPSRSQEP